MFKNCIISLLVITIVFSLVLSCQPPYPYNPERTFYALPESMTLVFLKHLIPAVVVTVVFSLDFEQRCWQFGQSFYHGSSCFIGVPVVKTQAAAMASCNHMGKGHLAFVGSQQTLDKLIDLALNITNPGTNAQRIVWIGLVQKDPLTGDEPAGKWSWMHPDGRFWMPSTHLIIPWYSDNSGSWPNNAQNAWEGCLFGDQSFRRIIDCWDESQTQEYICEYNNSAKKYKKHAVNTVGNNMTKMQETAESHIGNCAIQCSKELPCRAYSYNGNNGSCILHYLPSNGFAGFESENQEGYIMFDTYY